MSDEWMLVHHIMTNPFISYRGHYIYETNPCKIQNLYNLNFLFRLMQQYMLMSVMCSIKESFPSEIIVRLTSCFVPDKQILV